MSPRQERLAQRLALITGWAFLSLFGITTITAVPVGAGVLGAYGSFLLAVVPGVALILGIRSAFLGDRFWWQTSMFALALATAVIAYTGFADTAWAILTLPAYLFTLYPMLALKRLGRPAFASERNARYYSSAYLLLVAGFLAMVWAQQLLA